MDRLDQLKRKAKQARPDKVPNHTRAVSAYFGMVSFCYNAGDDVPEIDSPAFWELFDQLAPDCTRDEMRAWIDFTPAPTDQRTRPHDESIELLEEYLANYGKD